jgi:hypothetical protein
MSGIFQNIDPHPPHQKRTRTPSSQSAWWKMPFPVLKTWNFRVAAPLSTVTKGKTHPPPLAPPFCSMPVKLSFSDRQSRVSFEKTLSEFFGIRTSQSYPKPIRDEMLLLLFKMFISSKRHFTLYCMVHHCTRINFMIRQHLQFCFFKCTKGGIY